MTHSNSKTIHQWLRFINEQLTNSTDVPALEAELLLAHLLKKTRTYLLAWPEQMVPVELEEALQQLIARRMAGEPIAYILGKKEFWSLELAVNNHTLIPRPETELLVATVLQQFKRPIKLLELGTGSGAIAIALAKEHPEWQVTATDISHAALNIAKQNAETNHVSNIGFLQSDWCRNLSDHDYDVIVSNPPYLSEAEWPDYESGLRFEPRLALVSGESGMDAINTIIQQAKAYLKKPGDVFIEHGYQQAESVRECFCQVGYQNIATHADLSGQWRVTSGKWVR